MSARRILASIAVVAAAVVAYVVIHGHGGYVVYARFKQVDGLRKNSEVQLHGVRVGTVTKLSLQKDDTIVAKLSLSKAASPIGRGARAEIKEKNLLGARLVSLDPGDMSLPQPSGTWIPASRTSIPVDLDDVLAVLDPDTRARLRIVVNEMGDALGDRGADLNNFLGVLPPSLDKAIELVNHVGADNQALGRLLDESDRLLATLTPRRRQLNSLVDIADAALGATAVRQAALRDAIRAAPSTLAQLDTSLAELQRVSRPLIPAGRELTATAAPLNSVLRELPKVEPDAQTALAEIKTVSPPLTTIAKQTTPLVQRLQPTATALEKVAASSDPVTLSVDQATPDLLGTLEGWSRAIQGRDGVGHVFRGEVTLTKDLTEKLITTLIPATQSAGAKRRTSKRRPAASKPGTEQQQTAPTPDTKPTTKLPAVSKTLSSLPNVINKLLPPQDNPPSGGPGTVQSLLDYLLRP